MRERLQKILSAGGVASRRAAERLIEEGRVQVNGVTASLGMTADPEIDQITFDGKPVVKVRDMVYIMLNKPKGYVTTASDEKGRKTVMELVAGVGTRVYPVGRLDLNSEGLLIMTNDGEFANSVIHPSKNKAKTYYLRVKGDAAAKIPLLSQSMDIDGYMTRPAKAEILGEKDGVFLLSISIYEGRNRQVRKMCEKAALNVLSLKRVSIGDVRLGRLKTGAWRRLTKEEIAALM